MEESNQNKKTNSTIIKESREAFRGQWGNVFLAFIFSSLLIGCIASALFIVFVILLLIQDEQWRTMHELMDWFIYAYLLISGLALIIFQGRIWNWKNAYILKRSRGEDISNTDFKSVFEGISSVKDLKPFFLDKNNLLKNLTPFFTMLFSGLAIAFGSILLIIPGIIISLMFAFVPFISAEEKDMAARDVLKKSAQLIYGYKMKLCWCYVKLIPLMILCCIPCGLGLIWFLPYSSFVIAKFYDAHKE